jgi:hypothetical protein
MEAIRKEEMIIGVLLKRHFPNIKSVTKKLNVSNWDIESIKETAIENKRIINSIKLYV